MKNKKLMIVFILIVTFLLLMANYTKAANEVENLPTIITGNEVQNDATSNNQQNNKTNNEELNNNSLNILGNTNADEKNDTLPQTGIQEDTTLFIFIAICIASAIYAYFKIRKYNNIH